MKIKILLFSLLACMMIYSCEEETIGLQPMDNVPPGPVSEVTWDSIPGGAVFRYKLPDAEDLLYVKAIYIRDNGVECEARATIYSDSLQIEGFGDTNPKTVQLIAVDRSRNESTPVSQTITPGVPDIFYIGQTLDLMPDFGGVHAFWDNPNRREISVSIMIKDHNDEYVPLDIYYSALPKGDAMYLGLDTIPIDCAIFAQDRWQNKTEIKYFPGIVPIYEIMLDRQLFRAIELPGDGPRYAGGGSWGQIESIFDGREGDDSGFSSAGGQGVWPQSITIDLGVLAQVSRIRLIQRMGAYTWSEGNLKLFEVWGAATIDMSGSWDSWTLLMDCESIKPSGQPIGQNTADDEARARDGEDFFNSPNNPQVRYLRILVKRTWAGGDNFQMNEIKVYGQLAE
ncbi:MAG: DUF4959 domain-containing protein [Prevotellaceae bacterium]|jgi:hypothetical protein|nr:DUF4959 domain-containing protein [Prevotellaceae bacterium]